MQTQTYTSVEPNHKPKLSHIILVSIMGSLILFSGFMISLFLLTVSAIIFPFVAFKIWRLQRKHQNNMTSAKPTGTEQGVIIEAEYTVVNEDNNDK